MAQFSDPYEEWKQSGRPGGSFDAWKAGRGGAPAPAVPGPGAGGGGGGGLKVGGSAPGAPGQAYDPNAVFGSLSGAWGRAGGGAPNAPGGAPGAPAPGAPTGEPAPAPGAPNAAPNMSDDAYLQEVRNSGQSKSEDYQRFNDQEMLAWKQYYVGNGKYKNKYGDIVDKPWERGPNTPRNMNGLGVQGDYGGGWNATGTGKIRQDGAGGGGGMGAMSGGGGGGGGTGGGGGGMAGGGTYGGAPAFNFRAPSLEQAMNDPGYQFALQQGANALQGSAAAQGLLRTSGTLKDLMKYGQDMASQRYADVYGRQYQLAKDMFAPRYGSWETSGNWDLQKYLQREGNIYGLLNPTMPGY